MSHDRKIYLISLSTKDPTFKEAISIKGPIEWLNNKKNPPHRYYFRDSKPNLPDRSKLLFSFNSMIFGEATTRGQIQPLKPEDEKPETYFGHYKNYVALDPESITIYTFHPTKRELTDNEKFENYRFSQLYSPFNEDQYNEVLKIAHRKAILPNF